MIELVLDHWVLHFSLNYTIHKINFCYFLTFSYLNLNFEIITQDNEFIKSVSLKLTEYQLARPSDANRKEMLFGSLARPGHPMGKFFWGKIINTLSYFIFSSKGRLRVWIVYKDWKVIEVG